MMHEADFPTFSTEPSSLLSTPPSSLLIEGQEVSVGSSVRLHPSAHADAFDMLLDSKTARVEAIQQDYEGRLYVVVTVDDDPGREQEDERILPGHRFFFFPDEIEVLEANRL